MDSLGKAMLCKLTWYSCSSHSSSFVFTWKTSSTWCGCAGFDDLFYSSYFLLPSTYREKTPPEEQQQKTPQTKKPTWQKRGRDEYLALHASRVCFWRDPLWCNLCESLVTGSCGCDVLPFTFPSKTRQIFSTIFPRPIHLQKIHGKLVKTPRMIHQQNF